MAQGGKLPSTSSYIEILRDHMVTLVDNMNVTTELLQNLVSREVITDFSAKQVQRLQSTADKAFELLELIMKRPEKYYYGFLDALKDTGQQHLAFLLFEASPEIQESITGQFESSWYTPKKSSKWLLLWRHMKMLQENIELRDLLPHLVSSGVLTYSSIHHIQKDASSNADKVYKLVQLLETRPEHHYDLFMKALRATTQGNLAMFIDNSKEDVPAPHCIRPDEVVVCSLEFYKQHKDESYDMAGKNKGRVLIVNITDIQHQGKVLKRDGAQRDVETLTALFSDLGFTVDVKNNPDWEDIQESLENFARSRRNDKAKSVFVILMSHGGTRSGSPYILTADGTRWEYMKGLEKIFNAAKSPNLVSKPKVFLIQASMGPKRDLGVSYEHVQSQFDDEPEPNIPEGVSSLRRATFSDYLFVFATRPEYTSERNPTNGSMVVKEINQVFREYSATKHVLDMLTKVRHNVEAKTLEHTYIQTPHDVNCLKQPFYLFPGI